MLEKNNDNGRFWKLLQRYYSSLIVGVIVGMCGLLIFFEKKTSYIEISEHRFEEMLLNNELLEVTVVLNKNRVEAKRKDGLVRVQDSSDGVVSSKRGGARANVIYTFRIPSVEVFNTNFKAIEMNKRYEDRIGYKISDKYDIGSFWNSWGSLLITVGIMLFLLRRMNGSKGGQIFNIGTSKATLFDEKSKVRVMFNDVAGLKEAKEEIIEIVDFLKSKDKFLSFGAKIPKGVLLVGPPGTGKTLLAKAVAGEAGVPFFSLSGSDFVEMFVGVGASRVRDLFQKAKEKAPCIIFIDEIDAIGRARGRGQTPGGNDERENTLNSLLVEMDGFATDSGVIILAATNRPDILDKALLRPGRFDRQISIDKPDIVDRESIFEVYLKNLKKLNPEVSAKRLAEQTPGFAGAEIANVCNEAALIAARRDKSSIDNKDFNDALDRVIGGLEKKNKLISKDEKRIVAYHEAGHAVSAWFLEHANPLVKVTIVPRGIAALGYAQYLPKEQFIYQEDQILDEICVCLGGRVAEEIFFGKVSTGAVSDLEKVTRLAYNMVGIYGMNKEIGNISFVDARNSEYSFSKPYADATAMIMDQQVKILVDKEYSRVKELLVLKKSELELVAKALLDREIIFQRDLVELIGERPFSREEVTTHDKGGAGVMVNDGDVII